MRLPTERRASRGRGVWAGLAALLLPLAACDFEVTNPGPVQDKFLDGPLAREGIVSGVQRALLNQHYDTDRNGASGAREIFPGGNVGRHGVNNSERQGIYDETVTNAYWSAGQNARWLAESAIARFKASMSANEYAASSVAGRANLFAGYANRHLGEHFCEAVIDGGPIQPHTEFFKRSEAQFTTAIDILSKLPVTAANTALLNAARAGRASVRQSLGNWTGAVADAAPLANTFRYDLGFWNLEEAQWNSWVAATASEPFRTVTVWNTFYESYFKSTGDPRVAWDLHPTQKFGSALVAPWGNIPFYRQRKYLTRDDDVKLSSGREMRLIEAEALLVAGDWQAAMTKINALRTSVNSIVMAGITNAAVVAGKPLQPWTANGLEEAWAAYKKEHGIELWLEGRRLGARRRWKDANRPGALTVWEVPSTTAPTHEKGAGTLLSPNSTLCMSIPLQERQINPNLGGK